MVSALFKIEHGACGLCGKRAPLHILNLTAGQKAVLERLPADTHTGVCRECWQDVGRAIKALGEWEHLE